MLQEIIDSTIDSAVLSFFVVAPERSFAGIEIAKRIGMPYLKVVYSLNKMSNHGQLVSFSKKGKKYYIVNAKYALMPQIKNYLLKNGAKYEDELFSAIKKLGDVKAAFLSGLFTGQPNLPVDLLIVGKINLNKLGDFLKAVEKLMGQEINYSIMTVDEYHLRRDTFDKFIKDIFDYKHLVVINNLADKTNK